MISIEQALNIINEQSKIIGTEKVDLIPSLNKVLAENIYSKDNLPPFHKSAMDGYAIKSEDTTICSNENSVQLNIIGLIKAGDYHQEELKSGEALKIMTGAPLPKGSDAVIQIEKVTAKDEKVILFDVVKKGTNVIKMGEEIQVGQLALEKGTLIRPTEIGLLASLGYSSLQVYKIPKIALISTGDELVDVDAILENGKIRNANEYALTALANNLGCQVLSLGIVSDEKKILKEKILCAFNDSDIVITSGGVSVGDYDFVEDVLKEIGADVMFTSVAIKPGKPIIFAVLQGKLFFGLPGNPLSSITTFEEFVKPAIKKIMGNQHIYEEKISIIAGNDFKANKDRKKYVYVNIKKHNEKYYAYDVGSQCSNHLMTMSRSNGIVIIPEEVSFVKVGEILDGKFIF